MENVDFQQQDGLAQPQQQPGEIAPDWSLPDWMRPQRPAAPDPASLRKYRRNSLVAGILSLVGAIVLPIGAVVIIMLAILVIAEIAGGPMLSHQAMNAYLDNYNLSSTLMYLVMAIPVILVAGSMRKREDRARYMDAPVLPTLSPRGFSEPTIGKVTLLAIGIQYATSLVFVFFILFAPDLMDAYTDLVDSSGLTDYGVLWFVSTIILPPLVEELAFRGIATTLLLRGGAPFVVANALQALAFGAFHMDPVQGSYAFIMGFVLGYLVRHYGSLFPAVLAHAVFNLMGTFGGTVLNAVAPWLSDATLIAGGVALTAIALVLIAKDGGRRG